MVQKDALYKFIESKLGIPVKDNTVFFYDTGLDGMDAIAFMEELALEYKLDLSNYKPNDYHIDESHIANPFWAIKNIFIKGKRKKKFTAFHLLEVARRGKWFDPE